MKTTSMFLFVLYLLSSMFFVNTLASKPPHIRSHKNDNHHGRPSYGKEMEEFGRWYQRHPRTILTCNNYPRMCKFPGSMGTDCCNRQCVNLKYDPFHCGECGRRCGFGQVCCNGRCVNVMFDKNNCGWCNNKCRGNGSCRYGMCNYA